MLKEKLISAPNGILVLLFVIAMLIIPIAMIVIAAKEAQGGPKPIFTIVSWLLVWIADIVAMAGFFTVQPNQGVVLNLFGK